MARHENKLIITYTGMDELYQNGKLMYIAGRENSGPDDLGTIVAPMPAEDVNIAAAVPDLVLFSYVNTSGGKARLRVVLVKIYSEGGVIPSSCTFSVYVPCVDGDWISKTEDVKLTDKNGNPVVFNPRGIADIGDKLCLIDYETRVISVVTEAALEAAGDGANVEAETNDMTEYLDDDTNARGQAIIVLNGKVYALYLSTDPQAGSFVNSKLLRLRVDSGGTLVYDNAITTVGINAQAIIPVLYNGVVWLLIPAIGGRQLMTGATNGNKSNICVVEAEGAWTETATIKLTGDAYPDPVPDPVPSPTAFNIIAVGAAMRDNNSKLFILTQVYNDEMANAEWMLYDTTVSKFFSIDNKTTLSDAVTVNKLDLTDEGIVQSSSAEVENPNPPPSTFTVYCSTYFWDLVYEQSHRDDEDEDRLWIALGSPILVTKPNRYSSPNKPNGPFAMYYCIGGDNVNSLDLPIETLHQAKRRVSLKRGMRGAVRVPAAGSEK
jgi:hypothetical protein